MYGIIGYGRVGQVLAHHLILQGEKTLCCYDRNFGTDPQAFHHDGLIPCETAEAVVRKSDAIFLTVGDDALAPLVAKLGDAFDQLHEKLFIHTSGVHGTEILEPIKLKGAETLAMHPLMAFTDHDLALQNFRQATLSIWSEMALERLDGLWRHFPNPKLMVPDARRGLYHAGACVLSNYLTVIVDMGLNLLKEATGATSEETLKAAWSLIESAMSGINTLGAGQALTGPMMRRDSGTIEKHYQALTGSAYEPLYKQLVEATYHYMQKHQYATEGLEQLIKPSVQG